MYIRSRGCLKNMNLLFGHSSEIIGLYKGSSWLRKENGIKNFAIWRKRNLAFHLLMHGKLASPSPGRQAVFYLPDHQTLPVFSSIRQLGTCGSSLSLLPARDCSGLLSRERFLGYIWFLIGPWFALRIYSTVFEPFLSLGTLIQFQHKFPYSIQPQVSSALWTGAVLDHRD